MFYLLGRLARRRTASCWRCVPVEGRASRKVVGEKTRAAIVAVRHLNQSAGANALYRGGGSIGIIGAARCGLLLAADPEEPDRRILAATKGNLGKPPPSLASRLVDAADTGVARVLWEGETRWTAGQLLRAADPENLATLATLPLATPTSGPSLESHHGGPEPDPWDRRCLDCDEVLPHDRSNRCDPGLARALTG